ncbi:hypothetical protein pEaSNUABM50_00115 [Erwinia phage pEa_SNUABM_50]|uniref:Uncharacterized protein n=4 Tax=Eneladusvirus BF TaxID=2560751 RepID=A0A7L8ZN77_9CAUD|nr:hypothetical protein FDH34_gp117 [Serratia phage BF]QOI71055.1 hypothetical protein pEaSNUABM12_00117 [Erwinia phage pEa_SNUABM_12]QOI71600.1 hypothetical protein pEaSNUABM47_00116 [Erwinia phage pEa_SNUABM_47]QOI72139.1 hypothetical protein pEaSNUABM50_00115 [Erwinia phage pEa_SNUABM_50]QXO11264.1 hypothetical protein pEaSNUABM19_00118 [Erwinia phage pEa_SNUABM_19]QXO11812.1 hypothetical protein pEaSNUABM44_00116 [Erwinia phage pEa_SNUABM_44]QXO12364.1 hypothetical protein pEaSNUABM49_001
MAKQNDKDVKSTRKELMYKNEQLENLLELRRKGILTRQQFRLLTFDKGLQGSTKGSPLIEVFELEKQGKGKPVLVQKVRQWTRT